APEEEEPPADSPKPAPKEPDNNNESKSTVTFDEDAPPPVPPPGLFPVTSAASRSKRGPAGKASKEEEDVLHKKTTHFPRPPTVPDLDPADPNFLETMHKKFFPDLPADPSKLAWMAPVPTPDSAADRESPYYPGQDSLPVSALRFDFRGAL